MLKIVNFFKNKKIIFVVLILSFAIFAGLWNIVSGGYDKQNKTILFLKKFIPSTISRKVRDTIFIIPDLKEQNRFLSTQVNKYEQGFNGELFNEEIILSKKNKKKFNSNYTVSIYINLIYLSLIIPGIIFMNNGLFCRFYFFGLLLIYIYFYKGLSKRLKN